MRHDVVRSIGWGIAALLWIVVAMATRTTWHWGIFHDAPLMLYVAQRLAEGGAPYRDVLDMNMPGYYLVCLAFYELFGASDLPWRILDLAVQGAISALAYLILKDIHRPVAALAAATVALLHLSQGPYVVGQRDFMMVLPEILAIYLLFRWRALQPSRGNAARLMATGAAIAFAALIKPTALPVFLIAAAYVLAVEGRSTRTFRHVAWIAVGALATFGAVAAWLAYHEALASFVDIQTRFVAVSYAPIAMPERGWRGTPVMLAAVAGAVVALQTLYWREYLVILAMAAVSLLAYHLQGKYWLYQLAPVFVFALLSVFYALGLLSHAGMSRRWPRTIAITLVSVQVLVLGWGWLKLRVDLGATSSYILPAPNRPLVESLVLDLGWLGDLPHGVQPLDVTVGVVEAMLRLDLPMPTRMLYSFPLYLDARTPYLDRERDRFLLDLRQKEYPPIVRTDQQWPYANGYDRLERWPAFKELIEQNYRVAIERQFDGGGAYRIYVRR